APRGEPRDVIHSVDRAEPDDLPAEARIAVDHDGARRSRPDRPDRAPHLLVERRPAITRSGADADPRDLERALPGRQLVDRAGDGLILHDEARSEDDRERA